MVPLSIGFTDVFGGTARVQLPVRFASSLEFANSAGTSKASKAARSTLTSRSCWTWKQPKTQWCDCVLAGSVKNIIWDWPRFHKVSGGIAFNR